MSAKEECFLEEGLYEEEVVGDDEDEYETEDPLSTRNPQRGRSQMDNGVASLQAVGSMVMNAANVQTIQSQPMQMDDHTVVDPYPKPKHERCRCEARLYIHYHCAICAKPFALGCMLRHFQHLHYSPGTVRTVYSHLIDEERELYAVISYAQSTPNPAHVVKTAHGKRCSNAVCKARRKEGNSEECEHCMAVDDDPVTPEPLSIHQDVLNNCHKDFVDSYRQYCNSAAQNGVPAVCVLRAPPHVTSHIIYSCYNENNNMKRYLVVQCEPTISCSCGVGAEKACWHRAIVSLCCQLPGQSETDSLEPPFQTLFTVREMQRFIDSSSIDAGAPKSDKSYYGTSRSKQSSRGRPPKGYGSNRAISPRDTPDLEHAQILSELMTGPTHFDDRRTHLANDSHVVGGDYKPAMSLPSGEHIPDLLAAISRLNDTVELLRCEVSDLRSQITNQKAIENAKELESVVMQSGYSPGGTYREWRGNVSPTKRAMNDAGGVDSILEEVDFTGGVVNSSQGIMGGAPPAKKQFKLIPISSDNDIPAAGGIIKVPMGRSLMQGKVSQSQSEGSGTNGPDMNGKYDSGFGIGLDGDIIGESAPPTRGFTVNSASDVEESEEEYQMNFDGSNTNDFNSGQSNLPDEKGGGKISRSPRRGSGPAGESDNENVYSTGRNLRSKASPAKTRAT